MYHIRPTSTILRKIGGCEPFQSFTAQEAAMKHELLLQSCLHWPACQSQDIRKPHRREQMGEEKRRKAKQGKGAVAGENISESAALPTESVTNFVAQADESNIATLFVVRAYLEPSQPRDIHVAHDIAQAYGGQAS